MRKELPKARNFYNGERQRLSGVKLHGERWSARGTQPGQCTYKGSTRNTVEGLNPPERGVLQERRKREDPGPKQNSLPMRKSLAMKKRYKRHGKNWGDHKDDATNVSSPEKGRVCYFRKREKHGVG